MKTVSFSISDLICCGDEQILTTKLKVNRHIVDAVVSLINNLATVTYHEKYISEKQIKNLIADCGFHCAKTPPLLSSKEALSIAEHKMEYMDKHEHHHKADSFDVFILKRAEKDLVKAI